MRTSLNYFVSIFQNNHNIFPWGGCEGQMTGRLKSDRHREDECLPIWASLGAREGPAEGGDVLGVTPDDP